MAHDGGDQYWWNSSPKSALLAALTSAKGLPFNAGQWAYDRQRERPVLNLKFIIKSLILFD